MAKYKNLHLWMLIPMLIMQAGIFYDYWGDFSDNAWWLISTVFLIMMPALGLGAQFVTIALFGDKWPNIDIIPSLYFTNVLIIAMLILFAWKYGKLKHPATLLALAVNVFNFLLEPIGKSETVQLFLKVMIKG